MKAAWKPIGVPLDVVNWLVDVDIDGVTVVRSNFAINKWNEHGYNSVGEIGSQLRPSGPTTDPMLALVEAFSGERGTGQGDVTSPTCWIAIFDILLTALRMDDEDPLYQVLQRADNGTSVRTANRAYADDMISEAIDAARLQRKADIVSAFCLIFGLQFSTTKLRHFIFQAAQMEGNPPLIIRRLGWTPIEVNAETRGCLKSLGGLHATHGKGQPALDAMLHDARGGCVRKLVRLRHLRQQR